MIFFRYLLFPFSIVYDWITSVRNFLYDVSFIKSYSFDIPIIAVGNLSVGGTGKTPQIEYLIRLLSSQYKIAVLSRGYKRKTKGFILAGQTSTSESIGDEPFQMHLKFPDILVAVDANRKNGIKKLLETKNVPQVILLDDAFQHRSVKAGLYILLTTYNDLFCNDFLLPTGNLRESRKGAKRAHVIIVTKCPKDVSQREIENIKKQINIDVPIFFSYIDYDEKIYNENDIQNVSQIKEKEKLLLAGIAKPDLFFSYLKGKNDQTLTYPDHHQFTDKDVKDIESKSTSDIIITTEKDYVRLKNKNLKKSLYYLPIRSSFISNTTTFNEIILNYVGTSSRNR